MLNIGRTSAIVISSLIIASTVGTGALAQSGRTQMEKDSELKKPAVADAALARDEAKRAKMQANKAAMAARDPKAKKAAMAAARSANAASREASAATRQASSNAGGMAPK